MPSSGLVQDTAIPTSRDLPIGGVKKIILLKPRGFCAGVVRAIDVVRIALDLYGAPIYVRKEIVHNRHVVDELRRAGAIFVEELSEVPEGARVIFSAHGVSPAVRAEAKERRGAGGGGGCRLGREGSPLGGGGGERGGTHLPFWGPRARHGPGSP